MLISIKDYAEKNGKSMEAVRRHCQLGKFKTAQKIGRNWVIDSEEPYVPNSRDRSGKKQEK